MALIELYTEFGLQSSNWRADNEAYHDWCKENCKGWWCQDVLGHLTRWSFKCELDATAFKLRWL